METTGGKLDAKRRKVLKGYAENILESHKKRKYADDEMKEIYTAAEEAGFDPKALRHAVKMVRDCEKVGLEQFELFDLVTDQYFVALKEDILGALPTATRARNGEVAEPARPH